jgi:hypothetical protein
MIDASGDPMPEKQALHIFKGVLAGLNCAHEKAILHRDIKASNVMVDSSNRALLTDFGIARQVGGEHAASPGRVIGTPEYMSPEQFVNSDKIDHRSDVYSAGILLFEMLTGQLPFKGDTQDVLKAQHVGAPIPHPGVVNPKLKKPLAEMILKATGKNPDARYQGCLAFLKAIESYERGTSWKIWGLSLSIILAAGIWYFVQNLKAVRTLATLATDNYALLCREAEILKRKETGLHVAAETGNAEMVEAFSRHVKDHNANIERFHEDYANALHDLAKFRTAAAHKVFAAPERIDEAERARYEQADELKRAKFWELTGVDYERFRNTGEEPSKEAMLTKCPP